MAKSGEAELLKAIKDRKCTVGVIGLGYVGLPLVLTFHENGFPILGFDIDQQKVADLTAAKSYIKYIPSERLAAARNSAVMFEATTDFGRLSEPDIVLVCVPTPLTRHKEPDMSYIVETAHAIKPRLRKGQIIVLESTTYPGTTDEVVRPILEESGLKAGQDFYLAFSPEREDPGNKSFNTATIPKVVGGCDPVSGRLAETLYLQAIKEVVLVSSARAAEATKLTENIFRAVNIALVNELKVIYDKMDINIWEVLDAAATKPFGFMRFNPGPGWGGHCIPLDPFYLTWKAKEYGVYTKFIELAGEVNVAMPNYVVNRLQEALNDRGKPIKNSRVLILGIAYKKDIDDMRESPALEIMHDLERKGANFEYHDPFIPQIPVTRKSPKRAGTESIRLTPEMIRHFDATLIVTDHSDVDYKLVAENSALIVDTRGVYQNKAFWSDNIDEILVRA